MGQIIETCAFVASLEELCAAGPDWKLAPDRREWMRSEHPFASEPMDRESFHPSEPFDPGTPSTLDLSGVPHAELGDDVGIRELDALAEPLLSYADAEAARAIYVPLFGPIAPETDGIYRLFPAFVAALARLDEAGVDALAERWTRRRISETVVRPNASTEDRWADQARSLAAMSRDAVASERGVFVRLAFGKHRPATGRLLGASTFARHDFHPLFLRLTRTVQEALIRATQLATKRGGGVTVEHLLAALLDDDASDVALLFAHHGFVPDDVRPILLETFAHVPDAPGPPELDSSLLHLLVDTFELQGFASRLLRIRSFDLLDEILGGGHRYRLGWLGARLKTLPSKSKMRLVRLPSTAKESAEARVVPPI